METTQTNNFDLLIGIDPGLHTGLAVFNCKEKKLIIVTSTTITDAIWTVLNYHRTSLKIGVIVEDARQRKWFGSKGKEALQGAGSIKRDCQIWEDFSKEINCEFQMQPPKKGMTKYDANAFKKLTGWQGRTNSHSRDAAMLVFGKIVL